MTTLQETIDAVGGLHGRSPLVIVGVSGFAGSGKSTLARSLTSRIDRCARIRGDDFLDPQRSHHRSPDWDGVERRRLRREVLDPFRTGGSGQFRRFDWGKRQLGSPEDLPDADVLIVDGIGLFHPDLDGAFDLRIWVDVEIAVATERGKARDHRLGRNHDRLWDEVWVLNERDFGARFDPRGHADLLFDAS